jgi:hypothetical protein
MSGSGGGGPYGASSGSPESCDIVERVPLNSVQGDALEKIKVGDSLDVEVQSNSLVAKAESGVVVGSLTPSRLAAFLSCIAKGHEYCAIVVTLRGAFVEVEIRPR